MIYSFKTRNGFFQVKVDEIKAPLIKQEEEFVEPETHFDIDEVWYNNTNITKLLEDLEELLNPLPGNILFEAIEKGIKEFF